MFFTINDNKVGVLLYCPSNPNTLYIKLNISTIKKFVNNEENKGRVLCVRIIQKFLEK